MTDRPNHLRIVPPVDYPIDLYAELAGSRPPLRESAILFAEIIAEPGSHFIVAMLGIACGCLLTVGLAFVIASLS